jgi:hypothetical protein
MFANPTLVKESTSYNDCYFGTGYTSYDPYNIPEPRNKPGFANGTIIYMSDGEFFKIDGTGNSGEVLNGEYNDIYVYDYIGEYVFFYGTKLESNGRKQVGLFLTDGTSEGTIAISSYTLENNVAVGNSYFVIENFIAAPGNILYYWGYQYDKTTGTSMYQLWKYEVSINVPADQQLDFNEDDVRISGDSIVNLIKLSFPEISFAPENSKLSVVVAGTSLTCDAEELWKTKKNGVFSYQSKGGKDEPSFKLTIDTNKKEWSLSLKQKGLLSKVDLNKKFPIKLVINDVTYGNAVQLKKRK